MKIEGDPFSFGHPDFVFPDEIGKAQKQTQVAERAWVQERAITTRIDVTTRLQKLGALAKGISWAMYDMSREEDGSVATVDSVEYRRGLLLAFHPFGDSRLAVKLIVKSAFKNDDGVAAMTAEQVQVDGDGDCHHSFHGGLIEESGNLTSPYFPFFNLSDTGWLGGMKGLLRSYAVPYIVNKDFSAVYSISHEEAGRSADGVFVPGIFTVPSDAMHAIERGSEMLVEFDQAELVACSD